MNAAGFSYMRVPLGASDFSASGREFLVCDKTWHLLEDLQLIAMMTLLETRLSAVLISTARLLMCSPS